MTEDAGFFNVKTNVSDHSATFDVKADFDFEAKLNEIAKSTKQVDGWSKND